MKPVEGYETLANILTDAFEQASAGKGKERHANGLPFDEQPIMAIGRQTGPGGTVFQIHKKSGEALGMLTRGQFDAAERELLGSIVYAAATIMLVREMAARVVKNVDIGEMLNKSSKKPPIPEIPANTFWNHDANQFVQLQGDEPRFHGRGTKLYIDFFYRRHEFPTWVKVVTTMKPIPDGISFSREKDRFFDMKSPGTMISNFTDFHAEWYARRQEFPEHVIVKSSF